MVMVYIVSIEGVIGCGKSTVIDKLKIDGYNSFFEPIDDWSLLRGFYENPRCYAAPLQMQILMSYHKMFVNTVSRYPFVIIERSPWSSRYVFNKMHTRCGNISEADKLMYEKWYDMLSFEPDHVIYLKTETFRAKERYELRNRSSESSMSPTYIDELNDMYEEAINNSIDGTTELSVVNANRSADDVYRDVKAIIEKIF